MYIVFISNISWSKPDLTWLMVLFDPIYLSTILHKFKKFLTPTPKRFLTPTPTRFLTPPPVVDHHHRRLHLTMKLSPHQLLIGLIFWSFYQCAWLYCGCTLVWEYTSRFCTCVLTRDKNERSTWNTSWETDQKICSLSNTLPRDKLFPRSDLWDKMKHLSLHGEIYICPNRGFGGISFMIQKYSACRAIMEGMFPQIPFISGTLHLAQWTGTLFGTVFGSDRPRLPSCPVPSSCPVMDRTHHA